MDEFFPSFNPISLKELNASSALLERFEQKYIAPKSLLIKMGEDLNLHFDSLEHMGKRIFRYESVYFDENNRSFLHHMQGKRRRFKIRTRHYKDSGMCYLEMKVKTVRYSTDKRRISYPIAEQFHINEEGSDFIHAVLKDSYDLNDQLNISPNLIVTNDRITLVSRKGGERMTIDMNLRATSGFGSWKMPEDVVIIETKSKGARSISSAIMKKYHLRPVQYCSKYCIALAKTGQAAHYNQFKPVIRDIQRLSASRDVSKDGEEEGAYQDSFVAMTGSPSLMGART